MVYRPGPKRRAVTMRDAHRPHAPLMLADTLTYRDVGTASRLLVEARRATGLSQAALARKARIPRSVLNAYERGNRQPGADALASILSAAGFELRLGPRIDLERNARALAEVLDLAERLPWRPRRTLPFPPFHRRVR